MNSSWIFSVSEKDFDNMVVQKSHDVPIVVDFWAPWCGPCRQLTPIIDRIADQYAGKVKVGKVNVDENSDLAIKYDVTTIPRVLVFKGSDKPLHQIVGLTPESELVKLLDKAMAI